MTWKSIVFWSVVVVCLLLSYLLIGDMLAFADGRSPIITELMAAILGSIITVAAMAAMIKMQATQEKEKEYNARIFDHKVETYGKLITMIFEADDDNLLLKEEVEKIENLVGLACMVAGKNLVSGFAQFVIQLKVYGVMYFRSMTEVQRQHFTRVVQGEIEKKPEESMLAFSKHGLDEFDPRNIEKYFLSLDELLLGMRYDLNVVEGDISQEIEHFVCLEYDKYQMIKDPNYVG